MNRCVLRLALAFSLLAGVASAAPPPLDTASAKAAFAEAKAVSDRDGGKLWGKELYGPTLIVNPNSRVVIANQPDMAGKLHEEGGVYVGRIDDNIAVGNTITQWGGRRWTMWLWPLPEDSFVRHTVMMHESFHRIEPGLGIPIVNAICLHMDSLNARILTQLEWRALAQALSARGPAQVAAIRDALAFRAERRRLYAGAAEQERQLELAEGLAESTGFTLAMPDADSARWAAIGRLTNPDAHATFARTFIFTSVPAYGLLLDVRLPGWRKTLTADSDLGVLLQSTLPKAKPVDVAARARRYGGAALRLAETDRAEAIAAVKGHFRRKLVEGPTLELANAGNFQISFDTFEVVTLDQGPVYPKARVTDGWGTLVVTDGILIPQDFNRFVVAAPASPQGPHIEGPGWTLDLNPGWELVPAGTSGSFTVKPIAASK